MGRLSFERTIEGHVFRIRAEKDARGGVRLYCESDEKSLYPLCQVMENAWLSGPDELFECIAKKQGRSWEGEVAFAFGTDYPDEVPPGKVAAYFLDEEVIVTETLFTALATAFRETAKRCLA